MFQVISRNSFQQQLLHLHTTGIFNDTGHSISESGSRVRIMSVRASVDGGTVMSVAFSVCLRVSKQQRSSSTSNHGTRKYIRKD